VYLLVAFPEEPLRGAPELGAVGAASVADQGEQQTAGTTAANPGLCISFTLSFDSYTQLLCCYVENSLEAALPVLGHVDRGDTLLSDWEPSHSTRHTHSGRGAGSYK
jgi:hypothetical protein